MSTEVTTPPASAPVASNRVPPQAAGSVCLCGSTLFELKIPMRGFWIQIIDTSGGEVKFVESTSDELQEVRQPMRMKCTACGLTRPNARRQNTD